MIIDTGSKAFWLGALIFVFIISSIIRIVAGLIKTERSNAYSLSDVVDGALVLIICIGWWFGT